MAIIDKIKVIKTDVSNKHTVVSDAECACGVYVLGKNVPCLRIKTRATSKSRTSAVTQTILITDKNIAIQIRDALNSTFGI